MIFRSPPALDPADRPATSAVPTPLADRCRRRTGVGRTALAVLAVFAVLLGVAAPAAAQATGIDVASHQHPTGQPIDWSRVRAAGHTFAFVKASESTTYRNPWFAQDFAGAHNAGLYRGAYHYAKPSRSPSIVQSGIDQARFFVSTAGALGGPRDLPGVLDIEETGGLNQAELAEWSRAWLAEVARLTGRAPIVYTGYHFWQSSLGNPTDIGRHYRLWLASYPNDPNSTTFRPLVPASWTTWTFWQYTDKGSVPGIVGNVDLNRYCCDGANLAALAQGSPGAGNPFGTVDSVRVTNPSTLHIGGWAIDPDTTGPIDVHVYVDGVGHVVRAGSSRPDVAVAYRGFGDHHGFDATVPIQTGADRVCAYAVNVSSGGNVGLGCRDLGGDAFGSLDGVRVVGPGQVQVSGWAIDPNTSAPTEVHVYAGGQGTALVAQATRGDLAAHGYGTAHGFDTVVSAPGGRQQLCAYAVNTAGPGGNRLLGCRTVDLPGGSPIGALDVVAGGDARIDVAGWAIDPDTAAPIDVHVYVDGQGVPLTASVPRPDVARAVPGYGDRHGFSASIPAGAGAHQVCAYGINRGVGANSLLGCRTVTVTAGDPIGALDAVTRTASGDVLVAGWAIDPDTTASIDVHVYVGAAGHALSASQSRPDVGRAHPGFGDRHGFSAILPIGDAATPVCAYAINRAGTGGNRLLGCRTV